MKTYLWLFVTTLTLTWLLAGCGAGGRVDTGKMEKSFQSAEAGTKEDISQAVAAIKSGDYAKAISSLRKVIKAGGLSDEQKDGISTVITRMQIEVSQKPKKYTSEIYNDLSDLVAYLDGKEPITK